LILILLSFCLVLCSSPYVVVVICNFDEFLISLFGCCFVDQFQFYCCFFYVFVVKEIREDGSGGGSGGGVIILLLGLSLSLRICYKKKPQKN
jgi:hypothetical protein